MLVNIRGASADLTVESVSFALLTKKAFNSEVWAS